MIRIQRAVETATDRISARIEDDGVGFELTFRADGWNLSRSIDPFAIAATVPALRAGVPIAVEEPVSARFAAAIPSIRAQFHRQGNPIGETRFEGPTAAKSPAGAGVGAFFTGGVDAFHTALEHADEITHLVFVHGFDVRLDDVPLRAKVSASLREAADALGKPLIEVETNVRAWSDSRAEWGRFYHGSALGAVAAALAPVVRKMIIPASFGDSAEKDWGSNENLDPLWATEAVDLIHDASIPRAEKMVRIAASDVALRHLRVCYVNHGGAYNCGTCMKCLRAMTALTALGAMDRCPTFARPLSRRRVARTWYNSELTRNLAAENLALFARYGGDPRLERALRDSLEDKYYRGAWKVGRQAWWRLKQLARR